MAIPRNITLQCNISWNLQCNISWNCHENVTHAKFHNTIEHGSAKILPHKIYLLLLWRLARQYKRPVVKRELAFYTDHMGGGKSGLVLCTNVYEPPTFFM